MLIEAKDTTSANLYFKPEIENPDARLYQVRTYFPLGSILNFMIAKGVMNKNGGVNKSISFMEKEDEVPASFSGSRKPFKQDTLLLNFAFLQYSTEDDTFFFVKPFLASKRNKDAQANTTFIELKKNIKSVLMDEMSTDIRETVKMLENQKETVEANLETSKMKCKESTNGLMQIIDTLSSIINDVSQLTVNVGGEEITLPFPDELFEKLMETISKYQAMKNEVEE